MRKPASKPFPPREPESPGPARKKSSGNRGLRFWLRLNLFFCFLSIGIYYSVTIRPEDFWLAGPIGFLIPPLLAIQLLFLLYWLWRKPFFALFSFSSLLLGYRFVESTVSFHYLKTEPCQKLKVLSINAKTFGGMDKTKQGDNEICTRMIKQFVESKADVLCIQEMFDNPKSNTFNVIARLKRAGYRHVWFSKTGTMRWGASVGVAILSKYPILSRSVIRKKEGSNNQIIRAKIDVEGQHLVLINMHLQSIFLTDADLDTRRIKEDFWARVSGISRKLKVAYKARTQQIDRLLASTMDEELPVLICGDMNDTPYSNAYLRLRDSYANSFEEKGSGFGVTYNGKIPFLRIDHQFHNRGLRTIRFDVNRKIVDSDHFGTEACYAFNTQTD